MQNTYTSAYPQAFSLQHANLENYTINNITVPYFYNTPASSKNNLTRDFFLILLIPAAAGAMGFMLGTIGAALATRRRQHFLHFSGRELDALGADTGPLLDKGLSLTRMQPRRARGQLVKGRAGR